MTRRPVYMQKWPLPTALCPICGQPDNTGDCNHSPLSAGEVRNLGGVLAFVDPAKMVAVPRELFVRLMAAIETPEDLTEQDVADVLSDGNDLLDRGELPSRKVYRYCVEVTAFSEADAERSLVEDVCANGWNYDLEGTEIPEEED